MSIPGQPWWIPQLRESAQDLWKCVDFHHTFSIPYLFGRLGSEERGVLKELNTFSVLNQWLYWLKAWTGSDLFNDPAQAITYGPMIVEEYATWLRAAELYVRILNEQRDSFRRIKPQIEKDWERLQDTFKVAVRSYEKMREKLIQDGHPSFARLVPLSFETILSL